MINASEKTILYSVAAIQFISAGFFYLPGLGAKNDIIPNVAMSICSFAGISYTVMALGFGTVVNETGREFFYARYIDWLVTTPLLLFDLTTIAGCSYSSKVSLILLDVLMVVAGILGGLFHSWFLFILGCVFFVPIVYQLVSGLISESRDAPTDVQSVIRMLCYLTLITWVCYPVMWVLAEGMDIISIKSEIIGYAILDVLAKAGFGYIIVTNMGTIEKVNEKILAR